MRVVTVPVGYGDGYFRALSNVAHVLIRGVSSDANANHSGPQPTVGTPALVPEPSTVM